MRAPEVRAPSLSETSERRPLDPQRGDPQTLRGETQDPQRGDPQAPRRATPGGETLRSRDSRKLTGETPRPPEVRAPEPQKS